MPTELRDITVKNLLSQAEKSGRRMDLRDSKVVGLTFRAQPTGRGSWSVTYRRDGKPPLRRQTLGKYPDLTLAAARNEASTFLSRNRLGLLGGYDTGTTDTPLTPRSDHTPRRDDTAQHDATTRASDPTFGSLFQHWLERHAKPNLSSWTNEEARYDRHLRARLDDRRMSKLDRRDFVEIRDDIAGTSPVESNRVVALIIRVLNQAVDDGLIPWNPANRLKNASKEAPRTRVLSEDGIKRLFAHFDDLDSWSPSARMGAMGRPMSPEIRCILKLLLLTGQRRSEVTGAERNEFDFNADNPIWTIPATRTKNGVVHAAPLEPLACCLFKDAFAASHSPQFAFPNEYGTGSICPASVTRAMSRAMDAIRKRHPSIEKVSPHDLRRTAGTLMAKAGVSKETRGRVLNHVAGAKGQRSTDVYDVHDHMEEKRDALAAVEYRVREILAGP